MQHPFFKLTALLGVISAGAMVVLEAQKQLAAPDAPAEEQFTPLAAVRSLLTPGEAPPTPPGESAAHPKSAPAAAPPASAQASTPDAEGQEAGELLSMLQREPPPQAAPPQEAAPPAQVEPHVQSGTVAQAGAPAESPPTTAVNDRSPTEESPPLFPAEGPAQPAPAEPASHLTAANFPEPVPNGDTAPEKSATTNGPGAAPEQHEPQAEPHELVAAGTAPVQLVAAEELVAEPEVAPLKRFPDKLGTPMLLPAPEAAEPLTDSSWPTPEASPADFIQREAATGTEVVHADTTLPAPKSPEIPSPDRAPATEPAALLAQATPAPRTRESPPTTTGKGDVPDLFAPLPATNETTGPTPGEGADALLFPPSPERTAASPRESDPFYPPPIPGTGTTEPFPELNRNGEGEDSPAVLPPGTSAPSARNREPVPTPPPAATEEPLFLPETSTPGTQPDRGGATPAGGPEDLFLPQTPPTGTPATGTPVGGTPADAGRDLLPPQPADVPTAAPPVLPQSEPTPAGVPPVRTREPPTRAPVPQAGPASLPPTPDLFPDTPPVTPPSGPANPPPAGTSGSPPPARERAAPPAQSPGPSFLPDEPGNYPAPSGYPAPGAFPVPSGEQLPPNRSSIPLERTPPERSSIPSFPTDVRPMPAPTPAGTPDVPFPNQPDPVRSFPGTPAATPNTLPPFPSDLGPSTPGGGVPDEPTVVRPRSSIPTPDRSALPAFPAAGDLPTTGTLPPQADPRPQPGSPLEFSVAAGPQQPELHIEKDAPPKAVLNEKLVYNIRVRNVGRTAAHQVTVEDMIPRGSTLVGTIPGARKNPDDAHLLWELGTLQPGEEKLIRVQIIPNEPGEIGSVATVRFVGRIAAKTVITAPRLKLEMTGPAETAVGDTPVFRYRITNIGDGDASNVTIQCNLPDIFRHPAGKELEQDLGVLRAGQTREIDLTVSAAQAGRGVNASAVVLDGREQDRATAEVVVLPSRLSVERTGPERRFVNRPANYVTEVKNLSSQELRNVTVVEQLPAGMQLAAVPEHGRYDQQRRLIVWTIPQLGPHESRPFRSSLVAADPGTYASSVKVWDAAGNRAESATQLQVAGFSSLKVDVAQTTQGGGEVAVGEQVALRMTVSNRGSALASDVITEFEIPPELEFVAARPDRFQFDAQGRKVRFDAIPQLDVNGEQVIDLVCVARTPGRPRIAASIWSNEQNPIRQEEAVVVFRDDP